MSSCPSPSFHPSTSLRGLEIDDRHIASLTHAENFPDMRAQLWKCTCDYNSHNSSVKREYYSVLPCFKRCRSTRVESYVPFDTSTWFLWSSNIKEVEPMELNPTQLVSSLFLFASAVINFIVT